MLTTEDVRAVPLFSTLAVPDLELLARSSADLQVAAGDYALHPGAEERALFAVLAGNLEVFTVVDGIERTLYFLGPASEAAQPSVAATLFVCTHFFAGPG